MYILLAIYILIVGGMYRAIFGPYKLLTLFHLFYISYIISIIVALPQLDNGSISYRVYTRAALLTPILFLLGGLFGKVRLFPILNNKYRYLNFESVIEEKSLTILILFVCFFLLYLSDVGLNSTGLAYALTNPGDSIVAMEMRMVSLKSNISPFLTRLYGYSRAFIIPFLIGVFSVLYSKRKIKPWFFWIAFILAVIYTALSAAKAPVFYLLTSLALTQYWWKLYSDPKSAYKFAIRLIIIIILALITSSLFYPLLHGVKGKDAILYAWEQLNERVFLVPSSVAMNYFEHFGTTFDFLGAQGSQFLSLFIDSEYISSAQLLYSYYYSNMFSDQGLMNAAFFASLFANFQFYGLFIGTLFSGFIVSQVEIYLRNMPLNAISFSCRAVCSLAVMQLVLTDFNSILLGRGFLLLPVIICITIYISRFFPKK